MAKATKKKAAKKKATVKSKTPIARTASEPIGDRPKDPPKNP